MSMKWPSARRRPKSDIAFAFDADALARSISAIERVLTQVATADLGPPLGLDEIGSLRQARLTAQRLRRRERRRTLRPARVTR